MRNRARHHGLALMLVISAVAMATLIGMAMLSNASIQAQSAGAHARSAAADYLAESAVQTAGYYLQRNLAGMPASWGTTSGKTIYAQSVTVTGVEGSFDIDVTPGAIADEYTVVTVGRSSGVSPVTRTIRSSIKAIRTPPKYAAGFGTALVLPLGITFSGGQVVTSGVGGAGILNLLMGWRAFNADDYVVPTVGSGQLNYYGADVASGTYTTPAGVVGTPQSLASGAIASPAALTPLASNPGKVFYYNGPVTITGAGNYTGTLISRGKIELHPPNGSALNWDRVAGFPAMIADGPLHVNTRTTTANINGVVYAGGGVTWAPLLGVTGTDLRINGALLVPSGLLLPAPGMGAMHVNYTETNNDIQSMTTVLQPVTSLKLLSWDQ